MSVIYVEKELQEEEEQEQDDEEGKEEILGGNGTDILEYFLSARESKPSRSTVQHAITTRDRDYTCPHVS